MSEKPILFSEEVNIRRAPKYLHFAISGFVLGILIALFIGLTAPDIVGLLIVFGGIFGGGTGIVIALVLDLIYRGRGKKAQATKIRQ